MTPDDMEGRIDGFIRWLHPDDPEPFSGSAQQVISDLRALLLAYQERGRALERIAATPLLNDGGAQRRLGQVVTEARAILKGKSHD
jgi:hypothetical protein